MNNEEMVKIWEEAGKVMSEFGKLQKEWYQKSFGFRCWVRWDNFVFFLRKDLPNFIGYVIYRIKHPRHSFVTWREN